MFNAGLLPIDAIGLSFYSFWHGTFMDLKDTMSRIIKLYNLPVYIVETAHPWRHCKGDHISKELMETAGLDAGSAEQKKSLEIIMQIAAEVSKDTGKTGVYYWEPVGVPGKGMGTWFENMGMFDEHGRLCRAGMQSGTLIRKILRLKSLISILNHFMSMKKHRRWRIS